MTKKELIEQNEQIRKDFVKLPNYDLLLKYIEKNLKVEDHLGPWQIEYFQVRNLIT